MSPPRGGGGRGGARAGGAQVVFWFADGGLVFPPGPLPQLLRIFYRVEHHETRHIGGTGLGLALVKEIVEAHNGSVWVESVVGQGSTFFFTVPVAFPESHTPARDDTPSTVAAPDMPSL